VNRECPGVFDIICVCCCLYALCVARRRQDQMVMKVVMTRQYLQESFDNIRGASMIAFPMGLPAVRYLPWFCVNIDKCSSRTQTFFSNVTP
jgi:hypothetical protein